MDRWSLWGMVGRVEAVGFSSCFDRERDRDLVRKL